MVELVRHLPLPLRLKYLISSLVQEIGARRGEVQSLGYDYPLGCMVLRNTSMLVEDFTFEHLGESMLEFSTFHLSIPVEMHNKELQLFLPTRSHVLEILSCPLLVVDIPLLYFGHALGSELC